MRRLQILVLSIALGGCGGDGDDGREVANETQTLGEGVQLSYTLPAATYRAEITSSNNGVVVSWVGGSGAGCAASVETKTYTSTCTLSLQGQVVIQNPTTFGLGGSEVVTVRLVRQ